MKIKAIDFLLLILISGTFYFSSCSDSNPTTGTLGITVIHSSETTVAWENLYLATSLENMHNGIWSDSAMTDATGKVRFLYLSPNEYWYKVKNWKNFGSIVVYAGNDYYTTLVVTDPALKK
jgi:hypothetical protein